MKSEFYDVGIIGAGVAGSFALSRLNNLDKNLKIAVFEAGRPPMKRRHQIFGWLGCLPSSDGKLYLDNLDSLSEIADKRSVKNAFNYVKKQITDVSNFKVIKSKDPNTSFLKKLNKLDYKFESSDFIQLVPKEMHSLSKGMVQSLEGNKNINYIFDEEVVSLHRDKKMFKIVTSDKDEFYCKKVIFAVGRGGWRWSHQVFSNFGLVQNNSIGKYGIKIETDCNHLKELNGSSCKIVKHNEVVMGRFCWKGTVIPEDHGEAAITAFRSNEGRWETDKASFNVVANINFNNNDAVEQVDRIANLTFLLANDRIVKEKLSLLKTKKSKISIMKEYDWIPKYLEDLDQIFPDICSKSNFYYPTVVPMTSQINIYNNLETDVDGLFVAGESAGVDGLLSAMTTGTIAAEKILK